MKKNKNTLLKIILFTIIFLFFSYSFVYADKVKEFNKDIENRKSDIDDLKNKVEAYQKKIKESQKLGLSLKNQISILEDNIEKNKLQIEIISKQIQNTNTEIQKTLLKIQMTEQSIKIQKIQLKKLLQEIYQNDQYTQIEILFLNDSFSDFFDQYQYLQEVQNNLKSTLVKLKNTQQDLRLQSQTLGTKKDEEEELKDELEKQKEDLTEKYEEKELFLTDTKKSEKKFQNIVAELKQEQQQINAEIVTLEKKLREELENRKKKERFLGFGAPKFMWPTTGRYITSYFHDPEYPYRYIFEHPAIDIRTEQGSKVLAAESGYVAKVKNGGAKGYSYVMLMHNDGFSTVYGHVSKILVSEEQFIKSGDAIALSGGKPGTPGAGRLTTGPHLHFEVRKNGVPVDPLNYLP